MTHQNPIGLDMTENVAPLTIYADISREDAATLINVVENLYVDQLIVDRILTHRPDKNAVIGQFVVNP